MYEGLCTVIIFKVIVTIISESDCHDMSLNSRAHICHTSDETLEYAHHKHFSINQSQKRIAGVKNSDQSLGEHQFLVDFG